MSPTLRKVGLPAFCDGPLGLVKVVRHYTVSQLVLLMVTAIVVGVERLSLLRLFAGDAVVRRVLKLPRMPVHKTLFGLLRRFDEAACERLAAFSRALLMRHLRKSRRKSLFVDFDSTVVTVYGRQAVGGGLQPPQAGKEVLPSSALLRREVGAGGTASAGQHPPRLGGGPLP